MFLGRLCASVGVLGTLLVPTAASAAVRLPITFHHQEHTLSCEVAALSMALRVQGVSVSESELIAHLPFDTTPKGNGIWGDPNKGFVGNINGAMLVTGYGVYWDPIAKLGERYATTEVMRHGSAADMAQQVAAGNPVIVWGYYGRRAVYNWRTTVGDTIKAVGGEHTRVVYGFDGAADNPTRFYLIDPIDGYMSWSTDEFMYNWSALNHMAVVVKPDHQWVRVSGDSKVWEIDRTHKTRRWVTTWDAFISRGGTANAIAEIDSSRLDAYSVGAPIF